MERVGMAPYLRRCWPARLGRGALLGTVHGRRVVRTNEGSDRGFGLESKNTNYATNRSPRPRRAGAKHEGKQPGPIVPVDQTLPPDRRELESLPYRH